VRVGKAITAHDMPAMEKRWSPSRGVNAPNTAALTRLEGFGMASAIRRRISIQDRESWALRKHDSRDGRRIGSSWLSTRSRRDTRPPQYECLAVRERWFRHDGRAGDTTTPPKSVGEPISAPAWVPGGVACRAAGGGGRHPTVCPFARA
jgi:hypothetical protein